MSRAAAVDQNTYFMGWGHKDSSDAPVQNRVAHTHHIDHSVAPQNLTEMQWHFFPEVL